MRTDVMIYASHHIIAQIRKDLSLEQAMNVATLPGIVGRASPCRTSIRATAFRSAAWRRRTSRLRRRVAGRRGVRHQLRRAPGADGLAAGRRAPAIEGTDRPDLSRRAVRRGRRGLRQDRPRRTRPTAGGRRALDGANGYGEERDAEFTEAGGALEGADPEAVSERARRSAACRNWERWAAAIIFWKCSSSRRSTMKPRRARSGS